MLQLIESVSSEKRENLRMNFLRLMTIISLRGGEYSDHVRLVMIMHYDYQT